MVTRKKTGKKIKTLPTKPLSNARSKAVKGGIGDFVKPITKITTPILPPIPTPR